MSGVWKGGGLPVWPMLRRLWPTTKATARGAESGTPARGALIPCGITWPRRCGTPVYAPGAPSADRPACRCEVLSPGGRGRCPRQRRGGERLDRPCDDRGAYTGYGCGDSPSLSGTTQHGGARFALAQAPGGHQPGVARAARTDGGLSAAHGAGGPGVDGEPTARETLAPPPEPAGPRQPGNNSYAYGRRSVSMVRAGDAGARTLGKHRGRGHVRQRRAAWVALRCPRPGAHVVWSTSNLEKRRMRTHPLNMGRKRSRSAGAILAVTKLPKIYIASNCSVLLASPRRMRTRTGQWALGGAARIPAPLLSVCYEPLMPIRVMPSRKERCV